MKTEAKHLFAKAKDSLVLSIEIFNRPYDRGRISAALILLDHAFEMLLKAAIVEKGGKIRERNQKETLGFDACVRKALSDRSIKFLTEEQALTLQSINGLRDATQHYLLDISEDQIFLHMQSGVTLFRDICVDVFGVDIQSEFPDRILPIAVKAPTDLIALFDSEVSEIKKLLQPGKRRQTEASARLAPLVILDRTILGEKGQPSTSDLRKVKRDLVEGKPWNEIFGGVSSINISPEGSGPSLALRITKKEGVPMHLVPEGTPGASVVGIRRVDELSYYNLGRDQLARHVRLSGPKTSAMIYHLNLEEDVACFKRIRIGKSIFKRYSMKTIEKVNEAKTQVDIEEVWQQYQRRGQE